MNKRIIIVAGFVVFLIILIIVVVVFGDKGKSQVTQNAPTPTIATGALPSYSPNKKPEFRSQLVSPQGAYRTVFQLPTDFALAGAMDNITVARGVDLTKATALQKRFNFSAEPKQDGNTIRWGTRDNSKSLTINTRSGYVQFDSKESTPKSDPGGTQSSPKITQQAAQQIAEDFVSKLNAVSITPNAAKITTFSKTVNTHYEETNDPQKIYFYQFLYNQSVRGVPIHYQLDNPAEVEIVIDVFGKIRSVKYFNIEPLGSTNTTSVSLDNIKQRISSGDYVISKTGTLTTLPSSGTITINQLMLSYFDDKINPQLFPIAIARGVFNPGNIEITLYTSISGN